MAGHNQITRTQCRIITCARTYLTCAALIGLWAYEKNKGYVVDPSRNVANAEVPTPGKGIYSRATVDQFPPGECALSW